MGIHQTTFFRYIEYRPFFYRDSLLQAAAIRETALYDKILDADRNSQRRGE